MLALGPGTEAPGGETGLLDQASCSVCAWFYSVILFYLMCVCGRERERERERAREGESMWVHACVYESMCWGWGCRLSYGGCFSLSLSLSWVFSHLGKLQHRCRKLSRLGNFSKETVLTGSLRRTKTHTHTHRLGCMVPHSFLIFFFLSLANKWRERDTWGEITQENLLLFAENAFITIVQFKTR